MIFSGVDFPSQLVDAAREGKLAYDIAKGFEKTQE